ncbi:hypothetical protein LOTGIDRAFT_154785 [Lottia gigantea]|uniref:Uncharacterized protein n=1 Tax=Lottia gigantea TaxID=225164 RepID=V3ZSD6_LOTGI|nr:hypothetical protein LOTGIDRAFT_154785 [Lottia gigantea]ESO87287.1 hypothetical protein LOTGIDRAFT_154785 [Lottia gigantea]
MDLRKPKVPKVEKDSSEVMPGALNDGMGYNMAIVATEHLMKFALTKGKDINGVTSMMKSELADFLTQFYKCYKHSGEDVIGIRDGLYKFFQNENGIDIINDRIFYYANIAFDRCLTPHQKIDMLSRVDPVNGNYKVPNFTGVPHTHSLTETNSARSSPIPSFVGVKPSKQTKISYEALKSLYLSEALNGDSPEYIQNKVYFDINLYVINRGKDCLRSMVKTDFEIATDEKGHRYVWLKYSNKFSIREVGNVAGDERSVSFGNQLGDRMYERLGDPRCPVMSFIKYVTHLHPMTTAFWQRPKRQVNKSDYVWFDNTALGNSSLGKFMQKICLQAGLKDTYTNSSIKPVYIPMVESICQEAMGIKNPEPESESIMQMIPEAQIKTEKPEHMERVPDLYGNDDASSSDSEFKTDMDDHVSTEQGVGLREAKMEVLNSVQKLMVKDIQKFVDWLKTVKVIKNGGELMVLCSPVDKATIDPEVDHQDTNNENSTSNDLKGNKSNGNSQEASMENESLESLQGISIKQVDFLSLDSTHCSCKELLPLKVTIPTNDSMLLSGITDDTQLLLHRKCGPITGSEKLKDRVFYSENNMDVAEVAAILGTRKKSFTIHTPSDFHSSLPPRKRLTDPMFNMDTPSPKKLCNITNIDEEDDGEIKLETNLNCLKPSTLKSLPLRHKKKVRFTSGMQAFKLKQEPVDT